MAPAGADAWDCRKIPPERENAQQRPAAARCIRRAPTRAEARPRRPGTTAALTACRETGSWIRDTGVPYTDMARVGSSISGSRQRLADKSARAGIPIRTDLPGASGLGQHRKKAGDPRRMPWISGPARVHEGNCGSRRADARSLWRKRSDLGGCLSVGFLGDRAIFQSAAPHHLGDPLSRAQQPLHLSAARRRTHREAGAPAPPCRPLIASARSEDRTEMRQHP